MNERMKKIKFVVNPISGTQSKELILNLLDEKIDKARYSWEVVYTERAGHAVEIAAKAAEEKTDIIYSYFINKQLIASDVSEIKIFINKFKEYLSL